THRHVRSEREPVALRRTPRYGASATRAGTARQRAEARPTGGPPQPTTHEPGDTPSSVHPRPGWGSPRRTNLGIHPVPCAHAPAGTAHDARSWGYAQVRAPTRRPGQPTTHEPGHTPSSVHAR